MEQMLLMHVLAQPFLSATCRLVATATISSDVITWYAQFTKIDCPQLIHNTHYTQYNTKNYELTAFGLLPVLSSEMLGALLVRLPLNTIYHRWSRETVSPHAFLQCTPHIEYICQHYCWASSDTAVTTKYVILLPGFSASASSSGLAHKTLITNKASNTTGSLDLQSSQHVTAVHDVSPIATLTCNWLAAVDILHFAGVYSCMSLLVGTKINIGK